HARPIRAPPRADRACGRDGGVAEGGGVVVVWLQRRRGSRVMTDFGSLMRDVAPLLGYDPGRADRKGIARYRARGSLRIDYRQGLWSDYEAGEAGGVFDFIKYAPGERPGQGLRRNRLDAAAPVARATGQRRRPHDLGAERRDPADEEHERIELAFALWEDARSVEGVTAVHDYL